MLPNIFILLNIVRKMKSPCIWNTTRDICCCSAACTALCTAVGLAADRGFFGR